MTPIFYYSNFQVSTISKGVINFTIPEKDFHCRIWGYQLDKIEKFIALRTSALFFWEEVYDVDNRYNDVHITHIPEAEYKITCTDSENGRDDIVYEYVLQAVDFDLMMSAVIRSLKQDSVDKS